MRNNFLKIRPENDKALENDFRRQSSVPLSPQDLSLRRLRLAAELGDLRRFAGHRPLHALLAYAGMDSRVRKSGQWSGKIKMSKSGSVALRTALYQAASMARLHEPRLVAASLTWLVASVGKLGCLGHKRLLPIRRSARRVVAARHGNSREFKN